MYELLKARRGVPLKRGVPKGLAERGGKSALLKVEEPHQKRCKAPFFYNSANPITMTSALNQESDNSVLGGPSDSNIPADGTGVLQLDPWLEPFKDALKSRYSKAQQWIKTINDTEGGLEQFSRGYEKMGFHVLENGDITYQEWAPNAMRAYVIGDFSMQFAVKNVTSKTDMVFRQTGGIGMRIQ